MVLCLMVYEAHYKHQLLIERHKYTTCFFSSKCVEYQQLSHITISLRDLWCIYIIFIIIHTYYMQLHGRQTFKSSLIM